jgi:hypothetical protein
LLKKEIKVTLEYPLQRIPMPPDTGRQHTVQSLEFQGQIIALTVDGQTYHIPIGPASAILAQAAEIDRNHYRVAPSGYGIHWPTLDGDLSIKGLIKLALPSEAIAG